MVAAGVSTRRSPLRGNVGAVPNPRDGAGEVEARDGRGGSACHYER